MENLKIIIVVCIHDRFENLRRWIHAWNLCDKMDAKLIFVNNTYKGMDINFWKDYCRVREVEYFTRENIGFETGIIQDVLLDTLYLEQWDVLIFATDDTLPISKSFIKEYLDEIVKPDVGVACMQISGNVTPHIRTTGWAIRRDIANHIQFTNTPITTKEHCYHFEHLGGENTLMSQILRMDKRVIQLSNLDKSVLWDTQHTELNRWDEWHKEFPNYN